MSAMKTIANAKPLPTPSFDDRETEDDGLVVFREIAQGVAHSANGVTPKKMDGVTPNRKKKKKSKPDPRGYRWQLKFWLDSNKVDQLDLGRWIHELKLTKQFAPTVRKALALYRDLMAGEFTMLYQLFPDTKPVSPPISPEKIKEMEQEITSLRKDVDMLTGIIIKIKISETVDPSVKMSSGAGNVAPIKMLTNNGVNKAPAPPVDDDDDSDLLVIRKDESAGQRSAENFIRSAFALNGLTYDEKQ